MKVGDAVQGTKHMCWAALLRFTVLVVGVLRKYRMGSSVCPTHGGSEQ